MHDIYFVESKNVPQDAITILQEAITNEFTGGFHWDHPMISDPNRIRDHFCRFGGIQTFIFSGDEIVGVIYPRRLGSKKDQAITGLGESELGLYWRLSNIYIGSDHQGCGHGFATVQKFMATHPHFLYMARMNNLASQALAAKAGIPHLRDIHVLSDGQVIEATSNSRPNVRHTSHRVYLTRP